MDLLQLRAMGLVNSNPLVKREITIKYFPLKPENTWASPGVPEREEEEVAGTLDFWIRKFTAADSMALASAKTFDEQAYQAIYCSVFNEKGEKVFPSIEVVREVNLVMFNPLLSAIFELNGVAAKKTRPKMSGGGISASSSDAPARASSKKFSQGKTSKASGNTNTSSAP